MIRYGSGNITYKYNFCYREALERLVVETDGLSIEAAGLPQPLEQELATLARGVSGEVWNNQRSSL
jgi:hypothetical protein